MATIQPESFKIFRFANTQILMIEPLPNGIDAFRPYFGDKMPPQFSLYDFVERLTSFVPVSEEDKAAHDKNCLLLRGVVIKDIDQYVGLIGKDQARQRLEKTGEMLGREAEMRQVIRNVERGEEAVEHGEGGEELEWEEMLEHVGREELVEENGGEIKIIPELMALDIGGKKP